MNEWFMNVWKKQHQSTITQINFLTTLGISVGSNLVRFGGSFGFLRFGRFEVWFLGPN